VAAHLTNDASFALSFAAPSKEENIMFNVLNKLISRLDSDSAPQPPTDSGGDSSYGFQVLRNTNKDLPIEPWFDFIIGINGHFIVRVKGLKILDTSTDERRKMQIPTSLRPKYAIAQDPLSRSTSGAQRYPVAP
jgi:hypothetical protein